MNSSIYSHDELIDDFTINDFPVILEFSNQINDLDEMEISYWNEAVDEWYRETYLAEIKKGLRSSLYGQNAVQSHFVFYCLYRLIRNEKKALEQAKLAHKYYIKNTLSYQWEKVVYEALKEVYEQPVEPDCILPNNSKPDLVINPIYASNKYHPRGSKITRAEKIIDLKTSLYSITKESKYYRNFCDELVIIYLQENKSNKVQGITYISADQLKNLVMKSTITIEIASLQNKMSLNYLIEDFNKRIGNTRESLR